jgi:hypothetical protein
MSDVRTMLKRGVGGATPPPDGFERMLRRRDRKRRNQRITAGVVGIAVFVAAIWIVTTGGPFDRALMPASTTGPTGTPAPEGADRVGLVGLAPESATPSSPEHGELVLSFMFGHTMGDPGRFSVFVYADGRLIWQRLADLTQGADEYAKGYTTGFLEQRLTPEGVELVRAEVISTGLFDYDLHFVNAYGLNFGQIEVRNGDRLVRVTWGDCCDPASKEAARTMPTAEQATALQQIDARLADPASWLPASAWENQEITAYVPSMYWVCYEAAQGIGLSNVLATLPQPAEDLLLTWDRTSQEITGNGLGLPLDIWCSHVTTEEARGLAQILDDAGGQGHPDHFGLRYVFGQRDPGATEVTLSFGPLLPHET